MNKTRVNAFCLIIMMFAVVALAAPVPDTGQSKCYNATVEIPCPSSGQPFYGQDANYSINPMSYSKLDGSGTALPNSATSWVMVKDNVTGLIWENKTDDGSIHDKDNYYTWYNPTDPNPGIPGKETNTNDFINALNNTHFGGYSDWRLPTIMELGTIVNYNLSSGPAIYTGYFCNIGFGFYWSSTTCGYYLDNAEGMGFYSPFGGIAANSYKSGISAVIAVRTGGVATTAGYTDNGDGTVTDTSTGLAWQQDGSSKKTWEEALSYCETLNLGGYTDWRLPTIKELRSLVDSSKYIPDINKSYFPNMSSNYYWSGTSNATDTNKAWPMYFYGGGTSGCSDKTSLFSVRAIRGGLSAPLSTSVISVSPASRAVAKDAGATTFSVSNTGTGTMPWTATVTSGDSWLLISAGAIGTDSGTITCSFTANTSSTARTATIRVTATGATGSPVDVTVIQAPAGCTATLDGNLMLHISVLSYKDPFWGAPSFWAYFVYEYNPAYPALILFKMTNAGIITAPTFSCKTSEISTLDDLKIHIPNVLLTDGITLLSVDMEYSPAFSTNGNTCFVVTKYGVVPN